MNCEQEALSVVPPFPAADRFRSECNDLFLDSRSNPILRLNIKQLVLHKKLPALKALLLESSFDFVLLHLPSLLAPPSGHLKRWAFARRRPTWLIIFLLDPEVRVCTTRLLYHRRAANLDDAHCMIEVLAPHRWSWAPSIIHYQPPPQPLLGSSGQPYNQLFPHPAG